MSKGTPTDWTKKPIQWAATGNAEQPYAATVGGVKLLVQVNDYPDEQVYALLADGAEVVRFDDWPAAWVRPAKA